MVDKERIEGGLRKATGKIKETVGQLTGKRDTEAEGKETEQAEGRVRSAVGLVKGGARGIGGKK